MGISPISINEILGKSRNFAIETQARIIPLKLSPMYIPLVNFRFGQFQYFLCSGCSPTAAYISTMLSSGRTICCQFGSACVHIFILILIVLYWLVAVSSPSSSLFSSASLFSLLFPSIISTDTTLPYLPTLILRQHGTCLN